MGPHDFLLTWGKLPKDATGAEFMGLRLTMHSFRLGQMAKAFYLIVPKSSSIIPVSVGHRAKSQSTVGQVMVHRDTKGPQACPAGRPQQGMPSRLEACNVAVDQNRGT